MNNADYDSLEGIKKLVGSFEGLQQLRRMRSQAGYGRSERLDEWLVLGRWMLDTCGNFGRAHIRIDGSYRGPYTSPETFEPVMSKDEFFKLYPGAVCETHFTSDLPTPGLTCFHCKKLFTLQDYDLHVRSETTVVPIKEFTGKALADMKLAYEARTDAIWFMQPDIQWRNDKLIDNSPVPDFPTLKMNEKGWYPPRESRRQPVMDLEHVIEEGDDAFFNVQKFFHRECQKEDLFVWYRQHFFDIFNAAGYRDFEMEETPNTYCPCDSCGPWFKVKTKEVGLFTIGWRKRVINIDWGNDFPGFLGLFDKEQVTKSPTNIHAYGKEKATDYLGRILSHVATSAVHDT